MPANNSVAVEVAILTRMGSAAACAAIVAGCGTSSPLNVDASTDSGSADVIAENPTFSVDAKVDAGTPPGCSLDLHDVVDANGNVIQTCPPDQGCAAGVCVSACAAAGTAKGSVGCDFVVATPAFFAGLYPVDFGPCFSVFLANAWGKDAVVTIVRNGQTFGASQFGLIAQAGVAPSAWSPIPSSGIPPGAVGVLFLEHNDSGSFLCPITPAITSVSASAEIHGTGRGKAWHITTTFPVSGYDILPFGGAASALPGATLLLPTSAWGTNYIAALPKLTSGTAQGMSGGPQWGQIVAMQDNTTVQIVSTTALPSGSGVKAAPFNVTTSYTLSAGEIIQWQGPYDSSATPASTAMDMSGSILSSNAPIAFNGGNGYLCLGSATSSGGGCDSDHEQIAPVAALGFEYAVAPYQSRLAAGEESILYRFVGTAGGTTLSYDPAVPGAPTTLTLGQMAEFEAKGPFVVASQDASHPFHVAQMMSGCDVIPSTGKCVGDEDYTSVLPPAQFLKQYIFFTDPTFDSTNLILVRVKASTGFKDVNVDCVGVVAGWKAMGASGTYEWTSVDLVRDKIAQGNSCQNGPHTATSDAPFGVTVWGLSSAASYAYAAGGNVASINPLVIPPSPIQ